MISTAGLRQPKNNIRSFRFGDNVLKIIQDFEGDSLNEKFNNLVCYCFESLETRKQELINVNEQIEKRRNLLFQLDKKLSDVRNLIQTLDTLTHYGDIASRCVQLILEKEL